MVIYYVVGSSVLQQKFYKNSLRCSCGSIVTLDRVFSHVYRMGCDPRLFKTSSFSGVFGQAKSQ